MRFSGLVLVAVCGVMGFAAGIACGCLDGLASCVGFVCLVGFVGVFVWFGLVAVCRDVAGLAAIGVTFEVLAFWERLDEGWVVDGSSCGREGVSLGGVGIDKLG